MWPGPCKPELASPWRSGRTLSADAAGVYLGGDFTQLGGQPRQRLGAVDPAGALQSWAPTADATVRAVALLGSDVHLGGDFTQINGAARSHLAAVEHVVAD